MLEKDIERRLVSEVKKRGGIAIKMLSANYNGLPDRLILLPGEILVFVELKAPGKKPRSLQLKRHRELWALGFKVYVIDGIEQIGGMWHRCFRQSSRTGMLLKWKNPLMAIVDSFSTMIMECHL